eukprot:TRINITY_DN19_c0_g2_i1.p1 TRINITY_DN19_c0_g2~~TRINITY_DN19_c0_g2_i1.p1  ORF type:complete len:148 (-),score=30.87 TRINITY_DN19_c0_g2_i1:244-687(-)
MSWMWKNCLFISLIEFKKKKNKNKQAPLTMKNICVFALLFIIFFVYTASADPFAYKPSGLKRTVVAKLPDEEFLSPNSPTPLTFPGGSPSPRSSSSDDSIDVTTGQTVGGIIGFTVTCILFLVCVFCLSVTFILWLFENIKKKFFKN